MRLNAYLARAGVASRRKADELIKAGRVVVNGEPGQLNTFVEPGDRVEVDGEVLRPQRLAYVLLHKPAGVVTTASDPQRRPTVVELIDHTTKIAAANGPGVAFKSVVQTLLLSPNFLFRTELGDGPTSGGSFTLTHHELASALSYLLWDTTPDDTLLDAARSGTPGLPSFVA